MSSAVIIADEYAYVVRRYVAEGQAIAPGADLLDIMTPDGIVQTIRAACWGIVAHAEGNMVRFLSDSTDRWADYRNTKKDQVMYKQGDIVCHIDSHQGSAGMADAGLRPRPSRKMRMLRLGLGGFLFRSSYAH